MTKCSEEYDAAYIPMREPNPHTWRFDKHVYECLKLARRLLQAGVVGRIVLAGGQAKWYKVERLKPPFFAESDEGKKYLANQLGCPPNLVDTERLSQTSVENHIRSAEKFFIPRGMGKLLLITALERAPRLHYLGKHVLPKDKVSTFHFTVAGSDSKLAPNEAFALEMQKRYLQDVPEGLEGWGSLRRSEFEGPSLLPFWGKFNAARAALRKAGSFGINPPIPEIVDRMDEAGLAPGMKKFAAGVAGNLILPNAVELPDFRSGQGLLPASQLMDFDGPEPAFTSAEGLTVIQHKLITDIYQK